MYKTGAGITQNNKLAYMWLNLSAAQTSRVQALAADLRDHVATEMTSAQIAAAQKLSNEWKPK